MQLLRILTGLHAGAQLQVAPGRHRIGSDDDADIRLTDWQGPDAVLNIDATGVTRIALASAEEADDEHAEEAVILIDFVPMQFDDIVLCVGPDDATWPSNLDLMSTLLARPVEEELASVRQKQKRRRQLTAIAACVLLGGVIVAGALFTTAQSSHAAFPPSADDRTLRIAQALAASHVAGLHAHALGNMVVVSGMVANANDDTAVRALLDRVSPDGVSRKYDVAQNDARSIEDSLGVEGARVSYMGDGRFEISGKVANANQLEAAVARVRSDLDSNVKEIVVRTDEIARSNEVPESYSEMISSDDVKYAETPDGVKHIYAIDPPATAESAQSSQSAQPVIVERAAANIDEDTVANSVDKTAGFTPLPSPASLPGMRARSPG